jgi:integrase
VHRDGTPTGEADQVGYAFNVLLNRYGDEPAAQFNPVKLADCQRHMIEKGWRRGVVNARINRIRRVFRWFVRDMLVPADVWSWLTAVPDIRPGRGVASDDRQLLLPKPSKAVKPVDDALFWQSIAVLPPTIAAMAQVQYWTGARPQDVCGMHAGQFETDTTPWVCRPESFKNSHPQDTEDGPSSYAIVFGPKARAVIAHYLNQARDTGGYLFTPQLAEREREDARVAAYCPGEKWGYDYRQMPSYQRRRQQQRAGRKPFNERYDTATYRRAITRCLDAHSLPRWTPHQLRHSAGTRIRQNFDLDSAQKVLNHAHPSTTQIYAELDFKKAKEVMEKAG